MRDLSQCTVMVVDDTEENIDIMVDVLGDDYNVTVAMDGESAIEDIVANPPDLILLDIMMPGMDGYEVCDILKSCEKTSHIPVIFVTAKSEVTDEEKGLDLGAIDYITKPIKPSIVKARVRTQLNTKLANAERITMSTVVHDKIENELKAAREIQMDIVPHNFPKRPDIDIHAVLQPARQVGGDFYDFFFINDNLLAIVIGDVSGKGVPAALYMSAAKVLIKATAFTTLDPATIFDKVNLELSANNDTCTFVTVFLGFLDLTTGKLRWASAGHNPPLLIRSGRTPSFLEGESGAAFGIDEDSVYMTMSTMLYKSDILCLYTDGVTEAFNPEKEEFSEERLLSESSALTESMEDMTNNLLQKIKDFAKDMPQSDDITILSLRYLHNAEQKQTLDISLKNSQQEIGRVMEEALLFWREGTLREEVIHDGRLVLEEMVTNIVTHAFTDDSDHEVLVRLGYTSEMLSITTVDDGIPFDPTSFIDPDSEKSFDERDSGGFGIHLIRSLTDVIMYSREDGKNILTVKKNCDYSVKGVISDKLQ